MSATVQFNVRTAPEVAEAVRARARARGIPLGEALGELVEAGRAGAGEGVILHPDPALRRALRALAAAAGTTATQVLDEALRGELRQRLLRLADGVALAEPPARTRGAPSGRFSEVEVALAEPPARTPEAPPARLPEAEVGLFTVFD